MRLPQQEGRERGHIRVTGACGDPIGAQYLIKPAPHFPEAGKQERGPRRDILISGRHEGVQFREPTFDFVLTDKAKDPIQLGILTGRDVVLASGGHDLTLDLPARGAAEHERLVWKWGRDVWQAWAPHMAIAKAKGKLRGKQPKLSARQQAHLVELHDAGIHTIAELAELFTVSRAMSPGQWSTGCSTVPYRAHPARNTSSGLSGRSTQR